jgi:hypothetical protein
MVFRRRRRRRGRRRYGLWAVLAGIGLLLVQRRMRRGAGAGWLPSREELPDLARTAAYVSMPIFTPMGLALRLGDRLMRRLSRQRPASSSGA